MGRNNQHKKSIQKIKINLKKAFTLAEILIVLVILGMLSTILFRTYSKISDISFRTQWEKNLNQELVYVSQIIQNLSDKYTIDFSKYKERKGNLTTSNGFTSKLYLTGGKTENTQYETIALYSTGNCIATPKAIVQQGDHRGCWLEMEVQKGNTTQQIALTDTGKILFTPIMFKVIPFATPEDYYNGNDKIECSLGEKNNIAPCIGSNGFWVLSTAYIPYYRSDKRVNDVSVVIQNFFNN